MSCPVPEFSGRVGTQDTSFDRESMFVYAGQKEHRRPRLSSLVLAPGLHSHRVGVLQLITDAVLSIRVYADAGPAPKPSR